MNLTQHKNACMMIIDQQLAIAKPAAMDWKPGKGRRAGKSAKSTDIMIATDSTSQLVSLKITSP